MKRAFLSGPARRDAQEAWAHVATDNVEAANRMNTELARTLELLAAHPRMGRPVGPTSLLRMFVHRKLLILYRPAEHGIDVLRVTHQARDREFDD